MKIGLKLTKLDPPKMSPAPLYALAPCLLDHSRHLWWRAWPFGSSVLKVGVTSITIFPHSFIFAFMNFLRRRSLISRHIYFLETTLSPGKELVFEAFFAFDLAPFAAACFTGVGVLLIFFFFHLKRVRREFLFRFGRPLLLVAGAVGSAVAGGAGASTGAISCGSILDVCEGQKWGW